jgi:hypothetical protein
LFSNFVALSKVVSIDFYAERIGGGFSPDSLIGSSELAAGNEVRQRNIEALQRFTLGYFWPDRPLIESNEYLDPPRQPALLAKDVQQRRDGLEVLARTVGEAYEMYWVAWKRQMLSHWIYALHKAEIRPSLRDFNVPMTGADEPEDFVQRTRAELSLLTPPLRIFEDELRKRLFSALKLLHTPAIQQRMPDAKELLLRLPPVVEALAGLGGLRPQFDEVRAVHSGLRGLLHEHGGRSRDERLVRRIIAVSGKLYRLLREFYVNLGMLAYPYDYGAGRGTFAEYCLRLLPDPDDPGMLYAAINHLTDKLHIFQTEATGELAAAAERVEAAMGMRPLLADEVRSGKWDF